MMVRASTDNYTRPRFQAKATEYAVEKLKYELRLTDPKKQEKKTQDCARESRPMATETHTRKTRLQKCVYTPTYIINYIIEYPEKGNH